VAQLDLQLEFAVATAGSDSPSAGELIGRDPTAFSRWMSAELGRPVAVSFTDNRSTMLSCRQVRGAMRLRLHRLFLEAPAAVWTALVAYIGADNVEAGRRVDEYITEACKGLPRSALDLRPAGRFHELQSIFDSLNQTYFHGACDAHITWGTASARRSRKSIQLGSFVMEDRLIRIHPCLDQAFVPPSYVAWIVFHEMLHEVFGVERQNGRRSIHPPEFVAIEESYPDYHACKRWESENLDRLLRYRPPPASS